MTTDGARVRLTTGALVDGRDALADFAWLHDTFANFPDAFRLVAEAALGRPVQAGDPTSQKWAETVRDNLIQDGVLDFEGRVDDTLRKVIRASVRIGPKGVTVRNPFQVRTPADADLLAALLNDDELCDVRELVVGVLFPCPTTQSRNPIIPRPVEPVSPVVRFRVTSPGGEMRLSENMTTDRFEIALDQPRPVAASAVAHLHENGFTPVMGRDGVWEREIDQGSRYTDLIDAERVLLTVAEFFQSDDPARTSGRRRGCR